MTQVPKMKNNKLLRWRISIKSASCNTSLSLLTWPIKGHILYMYQKDEMDCKIFIFAERNPGFWFKILLVHRLNSILILRQLWRRILLFFRKFFASFPLCSLVPECGETNVTKTSRKSHMQSHLESLIMHGRLIVHLFPSLTTSIA